MTGYIDKFDEDKYKNKIAMPLKVEDKQILKSKIKYGKKFENLMSIDFYSKPTHGDDDDDDTYIKTKIKTYEDSITTNFLIIEKGLKKYQKKKYHANVYQ